MSLVGESSLRQHNFPAETLVSSSNPSKLGRLVNCPVQLIRPSLHTRPRPKQVSAKPKVIKSGRGDRIRTYDLLVPNQALYQAKLHPETNCRTVRVTVATQTAISQNQWRKGRDSNPR